VPHRRSPSATRKKTPKGLARRAFPLARRPVYEFHLDSSDHWPPAARPGMGRATAQRRLTTATLSSAKATFSAAFQGKEIVGILASERPSEADPLPEDARHEETNPPITRSKLVRIGAGVLVLAAVGVAFAEFGIFGSLWPTGSAGSTSPNPIERVREVFSEPLQIDRIYKSMLGPYTTRNVVVSQDRKPELIWMTGYRMDVVGEDGETPESMDFECHTNLAFPRKAPPPGLHRPQARAFTLTGGQTDLRLPSGFGLPMWSNEKLVFNTQALNLNLPDADLTVMHRAEIRYVRDADLTQPMRPLVSVVAQAMVTLEDEPQLFDVEDPQADELLAGSSCHVGDYAGEWEGGIFTDDHNRRFTPHWVVPPGRHEYRTRVTKTMKIIYDTTIHFIGVHVHPHSESLELRDLTTGKSLFKSLMTNHDDRVGQKSADYFSSEEGIPVFKGHEYELVSVYNNQTGEDADAMAGMFIYYLNHRYRRPTGPPI